MFIYHFSRLIKSKLLWGFLALLMVFAFVVMDSCTGASAQRDTSAGYLDGNAIPRKVLEDAAQVATIANGQGWFYLPQRSQLFCATVRDGAMNSEDWNARRRQNWKIIAAREVALRNGCEMSVQGGNRVLEATFTDANGLFNPNRYRMFLSANQYSKSNLFEATFANTCLPAQTVTMGVFNAVGWASPMELDFALETNYDNTTIYTASLKNQTALDSIAVSEDEITKWYNEHQEDYRLPEQRVLAYVELPSETFAEKITVDEMDAMQYYDDNNNEFMGTGTNSTKVLPFEEVKDQAIAKVKARRALEDALLFANETLVAEAQTKTFVEATKAYGETKRATVRSDRPTGFQNASDVVAAAFEMDATETPLNAIAGTDRVYFVNLEKVIPTGIAPLAEVRDSVLSAVRRDRLNTMLKEKGAAIRATLAAELAKGSAFDAAVAACQVEGLTATEATTFVLNDAAKLEIPNRAEVLAAVETLGKKALSEAIVSPTDEIVFVYVADRTAGDALAKTTAKAKLADELTWSTQFRVAADWLNWNLDRNPPTVDGTVPVLKDDIVEDADEE
jgi:peptidyl-prolyl cis-trans isomerase D